MKFLTCAFIRGDHSPYQQTLRKIATSSMIIIHTMYDGRTVKVTYYATYNLNVRLKCNKVFNYRYGKLFYFFHKL